MRRTTIATATLLACAGAGAAPPQAPPDWSADRFLLGEWSCELTRPGRPPDREHVVYSLGLGDHWLKLAYTVTPSDAAQPARTTEAYEGFDRKLGKWVYSAFVSDGSYGSTYSDGWKGAEKVYWPSPDGTGSWRLVATRVSETEFMESFQAAGDSGAWRESGRLRCLKTP